MQQPPAPRRRTGSARSLLISMAVVLALVVVWVALVPRPEGSPPKPVDASLVAERVHDQRGWDVRMPTGLPEGWRATSVRFAPGPDDLMTFHAGYLSGDEDLYVGLEQTEDATEHWLRAKAGTRRGGGEVRVDGQTWHRRVATNEQGVTTRALVLAGGSGLTVVVTGNGSYADLARFAGRLRPVGGSGDTAKNTLHSGNGNN